MKKGDQGDDTPRTPLASNSEHTLPMDRVLTEMETSLSAAESALLPLLKGSDLPTLLPTLTPVERARLHVSLASTTAVLLTSYLRLSGVDTSTHEVAQEFKAVHKLNARVKEVADLERKAREGEAKAGSGSGSGSSGAGGNGSGGMAVEGEGSGGGGGGVGLPRGGGVLNVPASKRFIQAGLGVKL